MLKVIGQIENKIDELIERWYRVKSALMKCTSRADILGRGGYSDRIAALTACKDSLKEEITELTAIQARCRTELAALTVKYIDVQAIRDVIYLRYGCLRRYEEIASILKISIRKVFRLHKTGLESITKLHEESITITT